MSKAGKSRATKSLTTSQQKKIDISQIVAVSADRLVGDPRRLYSELLCINTDEKGSIEQVQRAILADSGLGRTTRDPKHFDRLLSDTADALEALAVKAGADEKTARQLSIRLQDAHSDGMNLAMQACFVIGFACGVRRGGAIGGAR